MSFQPVIPMSGLAGWAFLQRTQAAQMETHARVPERVRDIDHFRARIADIGTAEDLVADRRLRQVMLGAFGLQDDIDNVAFIRRILEDGPERPDGLARRLSDSRYLAMAESFRLPPDTPRPFADPAFADRIVQAFQTRSFEVAVGDQDQSMRLAMTLARELPEIIAAAGSDASAWFRVLGNPPLRKVFETAFGFGSGFGALDIDQQLSQVRRRAQSVFGSAELAQFTDPESRKALTQRFLLMDQISAFAADTSAASTALTLLQSMPTRR